jgi:hypothetical protein
VLHDVKDAERPRSDTCGRGGFGEHAG